MITGDMVAVASGDVPIHHPVRIGGIPDSLQAPEPVRNQPPNANGQVANPGQAAVPAASPQGVSPSSTPAPVGLVNNPEERP